MLLPFLVGTLLSSLLGVLGQDIPTLKPAFAFNWTAQEPAGLVIIDQSGKFGTVARRRVEKLSSGHYTSSLLSLPSNSVLLGGLHDAVTNKDNSTSHFLRAFGYDPTNNFGQWEVDLRFGADAQGVPRYLPSTMDLVNNTLEVLCADRENQGMFGYGQNVTIECFTVGV